jgi:hypothetical protein
MCTEGRGTGLERSTETQERPSYHMDHFMSCLSSVRAIRADTHVRILDATIHGCQRPELLEGEVDAHEVLPCESVHVSGTVRFSLAHPWICTTHPTAFNSFLRFLSAPRFVLFLTPLRLARTPTRVTTGTCGVSAILEFTPL